MYIFILFSTSLFQFIFTFKYTFVSPFLLLYIIIHTYLYLIITQYCIFRHTKRIHNKSRDSAIILVDNLPRSEIERLKRTTTSEIAVVDYDLNNEENIREISIAMPRNKNEVLIVQNDKTKSDTFRIDLMYLEICIPRIIIKAEVQHHIENILKKKPIELLYNRFDLRSFLINSGTISWDSDSLFQGYDIVS